MNNIKVPKWRILIIRMCQNDTFLIANMQKCDELIMEMKL